MRELNQIITGHYIPFWGPPKRILQREVSFAPRFAVLEFAPCKDRNHWRYATNGMSHTSQLRRQHTIGTELYCATSAPCEWVIELLSVLAHYPAKYRTSFGEGDSIESEEPIDRDGSCYCGILLLAPEPLDDERIGSLSWDGRDILIHRVVGLLPSEVDFAKAGNGEALEKRLKETGLPLLLDQSRESVV